MMALHDFGLRKHLIWKGRKNSRIGPSFMMESFLGGECLHVANDGQCLGLGAASDSERLPHERNGMNNRIDGTL